MTTRTYRNGFKLQTFSPPAKDFDLATASEAERARHGFQGLSAADGRLIERLSQVIAGNRFAEARVKPRVSRRSARVTHGDVTKTRETWSGAVQTAPAGDRIVWVEGTWQVPAVVLPLDPTPGVQYVASSWVGIDGDDGSHDVLQAGCDADIAYVGGAMQLKYRPWYEWYDGETHWIDDLPVSVGDTLHCIIRLLPGSGNAASIVLTNTRTNYSRVYNPIAPSGTTLRGNCCEWIVEAYGSIGPLAPFTPLVFSNCQGGTATGAAIQAQGSSPIDLIDPTSATQMVICRGSVSGPTEVTVRWI